MECIDLCGKIISRIRGSQEPFSLKEMCAIGHAYDWMFAKGDAAKEMKMLRNSFYDTDTVLDLYLRSRQE